MSGRIQPLAMRNKSDEILITEDQNLKSRLRANSPLCLYLQCKYPIYIFISIYVVRYHIYLQWLPWNPPKWPYFITCFVLSFPWLCTTVQCIT